MSSTGTAARPQRAAAAQSQSQRQKKAEETMKKHVAKIRTKVRKLREILEDETGWINIEDYKDGKRLVLFLAKQVSHVLTGTEAAAMGATLLANNSINLACVTEEALDKKMTNAVKTGVETALSGKHMPDPASQGGRNQTSTAIAALAAMCFPALSTMPETSRVVNLGDDNLAYKAASVSFAEEYPAHASDFKTKFVAALTTRSCEMYKAIRLVIFDSLTATLDRVAKKNTETADEEESDDDSDEEIEVPARRQSCLITLAQLKETLLKEWMDHALASAGELAGRAFQTVRDQHRNRPLREIFALNGSKDLDDRVMTHIMFQVVRWLLEVLNEDRLQYNVENPSESQESEGPLGPQLLDVYEAPGFNAMLRAADWADKYRTPASGGGKTGAPPRKKIKRKYLDTSNDQVFNQTVRGFLGKCVSKIAKDKKLTPDDIKSKADANMFFKPYLAVSSPASAAAGSAAEGAATGAAAGGAATGAAAGGAATGAAAAGAGAAGEASG